MDRCTIIERGLLSVDDVNVTHYKKKKNKKKIIGTLFMEMIINRNSIQIFAQTLSRCSLTKHIHVVIEST